MNVVPMWPSTGLNTWYRQFRVFTLTEKMHKIGLVNILSNVNELESAVANVTTSVLERVWQERYDGEESCVLIPIPTSLQTWCTGNPSDHLHVRAQQNSE